MRFLLSSLLLACHCTLSSWSASPEPAISQTPDVSVMEGDSVNITCCWKNEGLERMSVSWMKNHTGIKDVVITSGNQSVANNCLELSLSNVTKADSGRYVCRITGEIPVYRLIHESGTVLTVIATETTTLKETSVFRDAGDSEESPHSSGTGGRVELPETRGDADDTPDVETPAGGRARGPPQDALAHAMRCLPVLALFFTFFYLYYSWIRAQPQASDSAAAPDNEATPAQAADADPGDEESAERSNDGGQEENSIMSED